MLFSAPNPHSVDGSQDNMGETVDVLVVGKVVVPPLI